MPYRQSDTRVGAPPKPSARSVSNAEGNALSLHYALPISYNRPLRRLTRPDVMRAHDSFRPSPGRSPRTSPDSFSRVGPPLCARPNASHMANAYGGCFSIYYRVEDDAVPTVRYSGWRSTEAQRPECVQRRGKRSFPTLRSSDLVQPAAAPPDQTRCHEGPRFISTVPRQEPPHLT